MRGKSGCGLVAYWLIMLGALNWGLIGLGYFFSAYWNAAYLLLGRWPMVEKIVYLLIGASAIAMLLGCKKRCPCG